MNSVFVDTAALIAMGDKGDRFHHQALRVRDELKQSQIVFYNDECRHIGISQLF